MSERVSAKLGDHLAYPLKLVLIDPDQIYRTGLKIVLSQFPDLQVVAEAENSAIAGQALSELTSRASSDRALRVDLVLLGLNIDFSQSSDLSQLQSRQLKTQYPLVPVLLLTFPLASPTQLTAARASGVDGYCPKGIPVADLVYAIKQVAAGREYWVEVISERLEDLGDLEKLQSKIENPVLPARLELNSVASSGFPLKKGDGRGIKGRSKIQNSFARLRHHLRLSGLRQIDISLAKVTTQLQPGLPLLEQAILSGQRRELLASRWLVNQLLATSEERSQKRAGGAGGAGGDSSIQNLKSKIQNPLAPSRSPLAPRPFSLFASVREKLERGLENLTRVPLEIDILREEKKRELLNLILQKIEDILTDLRFSQVQSSQLAQMRYIIVRDLWQAATNDFFGKYSTLQVGDRSLEIVSILLQDAEIVQTAILNKIPLAVELFSYLLFQTDLIIYNTTFSADSPEAQERAEIILQNLLIQLANGVVQPLLNHFADVEVIKQNYYDRRLISTREVERFRNDLSWKYRLENYIGEPKNIFESRYELFLLVSRGIAKTSIYAPRSQELARLSGIGLVVTLVLEFRDAIAPRLRAVVEFLGNGFVYILTQVVGRAIGLIGRGILQGLGSSLQESKNKKF